MRIINADHALVAMSDIVNNISAVYGDDSEDISQSVWLAVFKRLHDHGPTDIALLVTRAKYAALDEIKLIRSNGFRPIESEVEPPKKVNAAWVHGTTDVDPEIDTPAAKAIPEASTDLYDHLLGVATEPDEIAVVRAGMAIAAASDADAESVTLGTTAELMRFSGLSAAKVKASQKSLLAKLRP